MMFLILVNDCQFWSFNSKIFYPDPGAKAK